MNKTLRKYLSEIGDALSQLGNVLQMQAQSNQSLSIHSQVNACRYNLIKDGKSEVNTLEMESLKVALHHLLNGESYTHDGETSNPVIELYKMKFLIDSLYRLTTKGAQGSKEYIFDKIAIN